ncbi:MAG: hypothetical protein JSS50_05400 [Proteobacteria bacterium]|nr:hypothetical protein [Pseudomonadota bacterium]
MTWYSRQEVSFIGVTGAAIGAFLISGSVLAYIKAANNAGITTNLPSILLTSGVAITAVGMLVTAPYLYQINAKRYNTNANYNPLLFIYGISIANGPIIGLIGYYLSNNMASSQQLLEINPILTRLGYGALISGIIGGAFYAGLAQRALSKRENLIKDDEEVPARRWGLTLWTACAIGGIGSATSTTLLILVENYMLVGANLATWVNLGISLTVGLTTAPLFSAAIAPVMESMKISPEEEIITATGSEPSQNFKNRLLISKQKTRSIISSGAPTTGANNTNENVMERTNQDGLPNHGKRKSSKDDNSIGEGRAFFEQSITAQNLFARLNTEDNNTIVEDGHSINSKPKLQRKPSDDFLLNKNSSSSVSHRPPTLLPITLSAASSPGTRKKFQVYNNTTDLPSTSPSTAQSTPTQSQVGSPEGSPTGSRKSTQFPSLKTRRKVGDPPPSTWAERIEPTQNTISSTQQLPPTGQ